MDTYICACACALSLGGARFCKQGSKKDSVIVHDLDSKHSGFFTPGALVNFSTGSQDGVGLPIYTIQVENIHMRS